jgi:DNA primase small subunit
MAAGSSIKNEHFSDYYESYFPYNLIVRFLLLRAKTPDLLAHREISADYRTEGLLDTCDMIKTRWKSFENVNDFKTFLSMPYVIPHPVIPSKKLTLPLGRLHIGAHYNLPCGKKTDKLIPEFKEFVVDIDLSDYDNVRSCCLGKTACSKCWIFIRAATKAIPIIMEEAFGYSKILWIYSGRRGIHGWFYDENIHLLPQREREAMMQAISFINPETKCLEANVNFGNSNALLVFSKLTGLFYELLSVQNILTSEKGLTYFKRMLSPGFYTALLATPEEDRVEKLCNHLLLKHNHFLYFKVVLELLYPRFDVAVTKDLSHLIGCPFAAHLVTGNIATPIEDPDKFNIDIDPLNIVHLCDVRQRTLGLKRLQKAMKVFEDKVFI